MEDIRNARNHRANHCTRAVRQDKKPDKNNGYYWKLYRNILLRQPVLR
ncbi:hypothetical protein [Cronobacter dublinensis]|nr:hypothetical protein [Cronobacter dublinensis]